MKIIIDNQIERVVASSSHATFPASNLLNESLVKCWKAATSGVTYASLDVYARGITGGLGLAGIVADSATVTITDPSGIVWANVTWPDVDWQGPAASELAITSQWIKHDGDTHAQLFVSFPQFDTPVMIRIELRKSSTNPAWLSAGALVCGKALSFPDPKAGFEEGLDDKSIYRELSNGAEWTLDRVRLRTFSATIDMVRDEHFYLFMRDIAQQHGRRPMMISLTDRVDNNWVIYGKLILMPTGLHYHRTRSSLQFAVKEVV